MRSQNRFWNTKTVPSKLLACSMCIIAFVTTEITAEESTAWVGSPENFASEVRVPAEAVATDSAEAKYGTESPFPDFPWKPGTGPDPQVVQASYEEPVEPIYSRSTKSIKDLSDPGLIVPLEKKSFKMGNSDVGLIGNVVLDTPNVYQKVQYLEPMTETAMPSGTMVPGAMVPGSMRVLEVSDPMMVTASQAWEWHILPSGLIWHSYLAGPREPRISSTFVHIKGEQDYWDATVGGRASLLRFGTPGPNSPEGVEVQIEGAAFPRLTLDYDRDLVASDYRFGFPLVYRRGAIEAKFSYYHLSSHFGDEYIMSHPDALARRINYSRDAFTLALGYFPWRDLRLYGEVGYAVWCDGGSRPWEFQFGVDYSPVRPTSIWGAPFVALNGHLHQEHNYGGGFTAQAGVQWRGETGRLLRAGFQYFNGMSEQYQFYRQFEQQLGGGIWYDF